MSRPKHTKKDANHADVIWDCQIAGLLCYDTSDLPGGLDFIASSDDMMMWIEIKPNRKAPFTDAEIKILAQNPKTTMVAYCAKDVLRRFGRCE